MRGSSPVIASLTARGTARCIATLAFALWLATTMTFSVTLNYKCTSGATASFTITGANDTGPGAYRLQNQTQATQYMAYSITTASVPGTKITLNGQLVAASYRDAYVGNYVDTLNVVVLP